MFHFLKEKYPIVIFKKICMIMVLCSGFKNYAQVYYSTNPNYLKSKSEQNNLLSTYKYTYPDTSISELHNYFPRNFMGNMGMPSPSYLLKYGTDDLGFRLVKPPFDNDRFNESDVKYYSTLGPYANLNGIAGSKQFQIFKMLFTHTYKGVNITVGFNRYTSQGFYLKQQTYTNNFYLSSNYTTKKKRAGFYFYILNNSNKNQENGGIKDGVLTDSSLLYDKGLFRVNLSSANRENRELKIMVNPWLKLNKRSDSLNSMDHYIQLKSKFINNAYKYKDLGIATDSFYTHIYLDTVQTLDTSHVRKFVNELSYSLLDVNNKFGFSAGYKNEINQVWQLKDSFFVNHIIQSDLVYRTKVVPKDSLDKREKFFETRFNAQYILAGGNKGNYKAESNSVLSFNERKKNNVFLSILFENRSADYIYNNWVSNHFLWFNNGFKAQQQMQVKTGISVNQYFSVSVLEQNITNYLYFDQEAMPRQYSKLINNLGVNLNFTKVFFRHLGISLNHLYQSTSNKEYVRIPGNVSTAKLFYSGGLSHNNLLLQIGTQVQVYESFYGYSYMPSTQAFYLQDKSKTAPYPYLDVYLNARIRPVSFFLKVENILQGIAGPNYSFVPGYYQTDRAFRFGISWMFFD
jgi:hypothetical protein